MVTIEQAKLVVAEMAAVLKTMEWSKIQSDTGWSSSGFCPVCDSPKFAGHKQTCPLGNGLRRASFVLREEPTV